MPREKEWNIYYIYRIKEYGVVPERENSSPENRRSVFSGWG
jgi:hypothetical protein